jgi:endonuclease/exonuclease/phosphatase (EEP) superfamily protein YafD
MSRCRATVMVMLALVASGWVEASALADRVIIPTAKLAQLAETPEMACRQAPNPSVAVASHRGCASKGRSC